MLSEIKQFVKTYQADIILVIGVILVSLLSFAMGYIVAKNQAKEPLKIEEYDISKSSHYRSGHHWPLSGVETFRQGA